MFELKNNINRNIFILQVCILKITFFLGLAAFENEGIQNITALKDQLVAGNHEQSESIIKRHEDVIARWKKLLSDSLERKNRLLVMQVCWLQESTWIWSLPSRVESMGG